MLTDDPGTPGNGHLEINLAAAVERRANDQSWQLPVLDLNYGVGERIQLNFQTSCIVSERDANGPAAGPGTAAVAVKWRFFDQGDESMSISTYPRVECPVIRASVRRGLVDDGTRLLLPIEIARRVGAVDIDVEIGSLLRSVGRSEWIYGLVAGTRVTSTTGVMAEIHGDARTSFARDRLTVNVGIRQKLTGWSTLIASVGHDVRSATGEDSAFIGYFGVQLLF